MLTRFAQTYEITKVSRNLYKNYSIVFYSKERIVEIFFWPEKKQFWNPKIDWGNVFFKCNYFPIIQAVVYCVQEVSYSPFSTDHSPKHLFFLYTLRPTSVKKIPNLNSNFGPDRGRGLKSVSEHLADSLPFSILMQRCNHVTNQKSLYWLTAFYTF